MINAILKMDLNKKIGKNDGTLGRVLNKDMAMFKEHTEGHIVIMGYSTFKNDMKGIPLKNRHNIVMTSKKDLPEVDGVMFANSMMEAISLGMALSSRYFPQEVKNIWIIGGASVVNQALSKGFIDNLLLNVYSYHEDETFTIGLEDSIELKMYDDMANVWGVEDVIIEGYKLESKKHYFDESKSKVIPSTLFVLNREGNDF